MLNITKKYISVISKYMNTQARLSFSPGGRPIAASSAGRLRSWRCFLPPALGAVAAWCPWPGRARRPQWRRETGWLSRPHRPRARGARARLQPPRAALPWAPRVHGLLCPRLHPRATPTLSRPGALPTGATSHTTPVAGTLLEGCVFRETPGVKFRKGPSVAGPVSECAHRAATRTPCPAPGRAPSCSSPGCGLVFKYYQYVIDVNSVQILTLSYFKLYLQTPVS